jgi:hypothetical protein
MFAAVRRQNQLATHLETPILAGSSTVQAVTLPQNDEVAESVVAFAGSLDRVRLFVLRPLRTTADWAAGDLHIVPSILNVFRTHDGQFIRRPGDRDNFAIGPVGYVSVGIQTTDGE